MSTALTIRQARRDLVRRTLEQCPGVDPRSLPTFAGWAPAILAQAIADAAEATPEGRAA